MDIARHKFHKVWRINSYLKLSTEKLNNLNVYLSGLFRKSLNQRGILCTTFIFLDKNFLEKQSCIDEGGIFISVKRAEE